jgi:ATP-dependent protease ClpP protease subunit
MPIQFQCNTNSATLALSGELNQALVLDMRDKLRLASDYYKYDRIEIVINSPGGEALALKALVCEMQWLRSRGCTVSTTAMMEAGSAAALVLALGDVGHRKVQPYSNLVFHHTRIIRSGEHALTAIGASAAARNLESYDETLMGMLVKHLQSAHGSLQALANTGLQRCQTLQRETSVVAEQLGLEAPSKVESGRSARGKRNGPAWLGQTLAAYERVLRSNSAKAFTGLLADFFAMDSCMPVEMAWVLQLVDSVEGTSVLQPQMPAVRAPLPEASNTAFKERLAA